MYIEQFDLERVAKNEEVRELVTEILDVYRLSYQRQDISISYKDAFQENPGGQVVKDINESINEAMDYVQRIILTKEQVSELLNLYTENELIRFTNYTGNLDNKFTEDLIRVMVAQDILEKTVKIILHRATVNNLDHLIHDLRSRETKKQTTSNIIDKVRTISNYLTNSRGSLQDTLNNALIALNNSDESEMTIEFEMVDDPLRIEASFHTEDEYMRDDYKQSPNYLTDVWMNITEDLEDSSEEIIMDSWHLQVNYVMNREINELLQKIS